MKPRTKIRRAQVVIAIAVLIAVLGANIGNWLLVGSMVIVVVVQAADYRIHRNKLH